MHFYSDVKDFDGSLMLLSNHFSWWDGFIAYRLNDQLFHKQFYLMMLERELSRRPFFRLLGAFSIRKHSRDALTSLRFAASVLGEANTLVAMFPQGRIESMHLNRFHWEQGIAQVMRLAEKPFRLIFSVTLADYMASPKPSLSIYIGEYIWSANNSPSLGEIEEGYNAFYRDCQRRQSQQYV